MLLQEPNPQLDRSLTICLKAQARQVARRRRDSSPEGLAHAIDDYNLIARECTPAVFAATHLPRSLDL